MKSTLKIAVLTVTLALAATSMFGATASTTNLNNVTATVNGSCQWITQMTMAFPAYDPFSAVADTQTTTVTFKCVKKTNATDTYKIWFSKTGGNMNNGTDNLAYTLTDGAGGALATNAGASVAVVGTPGVGAAAGYTYTVKGSIAAGQDVSTGSYVDTVVVNVEY
ncbi:MAG TPA: spore coat protein U domain-containing protein [Thermoanaerobaculia bacterium]|nr:spore coat protein U domain-containing protein [Thermoanaerobaculia bacterium]